MRKPSPMPAPRWLDEYQSSWLPKDLLAGLTLAAYAIPVSIAYASLAGLPGQAGFYCYLFGGLGYAFVGGSRQLAIGPTAAISMALGAALVPLAGGDPSRLAGLAALTALLVAAMGFVGWLLRFSQLVNFVSETALLGFKAGAALSIAVTQLPKLFGVPGGGHSFFQRLHELAAQLGNTNPTVLFLGLAALLALFLGDRFLPGRPIALFVVIASLLVMSFTGLGGQGVKVVGELPQGLPTIHLPDAGFGDIDDLFPLAFACLLLSYVESVSAGKAFAETHRYRIDPRRELLALGMANLLAGLGQGYPVAGGLSQTAVNDKAGARSPAALLWASLVIGLVLLFLAGFFRNLPEAVLAAIVLMAVKGLIDLRELAHVFRVSRFDFRVAITALIGVLLLGILKGILLAPCCPLLLCCAAPPIPMSPSWAGYRARTGSPTLKGTPTTRLSRACSFSASRRPSCISTRSRWKTWFSRRGSVKTGSWNWSSATLPARHTWIWSPPGCCCAWSGNCPPGDAGCASSTPTPMSATCCGPRA